MPRADTYSGWFPLATQFPPSLNTEDDPTVLKPFESPDCYGVDWEQEGRLAVGSVPTGTARDAPAKTIGAVAYLYYYKRLWRASGAKLYYGAQDYDDYFYAQDLGIFEFDHTIITYMPVMDSAIWVATATGSYLIPNANDPRSFFEPQRIAQELVVATAANALVLDGSAFASNAGGVFSWDGGAVKEWTRKVRNTLGNFDAATITADYEKKAIIGTSKFVIDTTTGKLFDYGTSGFRFVTRTLAQPDQWQPFKVDSVAMIIERTNQNTGTIKWQTKAEDAAWYTEQDVILTEERNRAVLAINNPNKAVRKFALRITSLSSNIRIEHIQMSVVGLAQTVVESET